MLLCLAWFDVAAAWRPAWLAAVPILVLAVPTALLAGAWAVSVRTDLAAGRGPAAGARTDGAALLAVALSVLFRLPMAWHGAAGYVTSDGALSGIVATRLRDGLDHFVFVPGVPYSGSLKSHLAALLSVLLDMPQAFALASVLFYGVFVAAVCSFAREVARQEGRSERRAVLSAGLYAAFAPAFVTRYSLSNDGNYVEVLALGTWALLLASRWAATAVRPTSDLAEPGKSHGSSLPLVIGLLLGLACWSHILAIIHLAAVGATFLVLGGGRGLRAIPPAAIGVLLGYLPGLLWNAGNGWESLRYVIPGGQPVGALEQGPGLLGRTIGLLFDQAPVLLGYDPGNPPPFDTVLLVLAWLAVAAVVAAGLAAGRAALERGQVALRVLLLFTAANVTIAVAALPYIAGNPRYLLFLVAPAAVFLARAPEGDPRRFALAALVVFGALGSTAQVPRAFRSDVQWRGFVTALRLEGVHFCYTDFFLASKVSFLSGEEIVCSAGLGPTTTEYFQDHRQRVDGAADAALIAVNPTAAGKLERRLERLGVAFERRDLMKPVLLRLSRKVTPEELFSGAR